MKDLEIIKSFLINSHFITWKIGEFDLEQDKASKFITITSQHKKVFVVKNHQYMNNRMKACYISFYIKTRNQPNNLTTWQLN